LPSTNRRKWITAGVVALVVVASLVIAWRVRASRAPALDASRDKLVKFVASDKFQGLPKNEQKQYADAMMSKPMVITEKEIGQDQLDAMKAAAQAHRQQMMDDYFKLTDAAAKKAYLDKMIDDQEKVRKMMEEQDKPGANNEGKMRVMIKSGGSGAAAQKSANENTPPALQAQTAQFVKDLNDRRAERGLPPQQGFMMIRFNGSGPGGQK
jgi:hypothetical protein